MVTLLPTDVAEGPVVPGVLGDVADLVDRVVMEQHLSNTQRRGKGGRGWFKHRSRNMQMKEGAKDLLSVPAC